MIEVFDKVLANATAYRALALRAPFQSMTFGPDTFHGVAPAQGDEFAGWFAKNFPQYTPTLTFLRKSPMGQVEPNFIHTDEGMGDVTAILYLNPKPAADDGTSFWEHSESGKREGSVSGEAGKDLGKWIRWKTVPAAFNRAVVFSAPLFHSRAIEANYGQNEDARLIQVLFARR